MFPNIDIQGALGLFFLIVGFSFIIFVHELGHFMIAKWVGIKVTQFAIGFGHCMVAWRSGLGVRFGSTEAEYDKRIRKQLEADGPVEVKDGQWMRDDEPIPTTAITQAADALGLGETEYRFNYIPLGGYVKMLGQEDIDPTAVSDDPRAYTSKSVGARMCVISAGVIMNMIFALILFVIAFTNGVGFAPAVVGDVVPDFPASEAYAVGHEDDENYKGLQPGDRITHIAGNETLDFTDVRLAAALGRPDEAIELTIRRAGHDKELIYRIAPEKKKGAPLPQLGIAEPVSLQLSDETDLLTPDLIDAGVKGQMRIVAVDGQVVEDYPQYRSIVAAARGKPVEVNFESEDDEQKVTTTLRAVAALTKGEDDEFYHLLGLVPAIAVQDVVPDSPAEQADIQRGDLIARIETFDWPSRKQLLDAVKGADDKPLMLLVQRGREQLEIQVQPVKGKIGIHMGMGTSPAVARTLNPSPAAALNLPAGSRITAINGRNVETFADMQRVLQDELGQGDQTTSIDVTYQLNLPGFDTATRSVDVTAEQARQIIDAKWLQPLVNLLPLEIQLVGDNPIDAVKLGIAKTRQTMVSTYATLLALVEGRLSPKELRGPIGIADIGTQVYRQRGMMWLIFFLGLISVNLAVINFLPIPVVDGGHMVFLLVEKIKGSPVGPRLQTWATMAGLTAIGCLFLVVTFNDILRLVRLGE